VSTRVEFRELRQLVDLSLSECAKKAGMKPMRLSYIEWGKERPTLDELKSLSKILGFSEETIVASLPTDEEVAADNKRAFDTISAMNACRADADAKGIRQGSGGMGEIECPVCHGVLRYSVAGYNGHLWGQCQTQGCVQWMQ
jgi:transcriptional regulator with XRE-family HTH domain